MPFMVPVLAAVGGGSAVAGGLALAGTAAGAISAADAARKTSHAAQDAATAAQNAKVDIPALDQQARDIAKQNALDSAALEKQLTPEVPQLRTAANQAVLNNIGGSPQQNALTNFALSRFGQPATTAQFNPTTLGNIPSLTDNYQQVQLGATPDFQRTNLTATPAMATPNLQSPLLQDAINKARADLGLGGRLSIDQQNAATRQGAAEAGRAGGGNSLGLGRDLSARDLGLTAYQVEQQRLQNASQLGSQDIAAQQAQQQALLNASQFNLSNNLGAANFGLSQNAQEANYGLQKSLGVGGFYASQAANTANYNLQKANYGLNSALAQGNFAAGQNLNAAQFGLSRDQLNAQNFLNQYNALNTYYNNSRQQDLASAAYGQSIAQPVTGLDPSAVANLAVGNQNIATQGAINAANIQAKQGQNQMGFGGQLLGYGMNTFSNYGQNPSPTTYGAAYGSTGLSFGS